MFLCFAASVAANDKLYEHFQNPPPEARPFVRWWWNGNCVNEAEILRELDVMKAAGIGGVEINPIAIPEDAPKTQGDCLTWGSSEWAEIVKMAADAAKDRGMITDIIIGTGWPFGGSFLEPDEQIKGVVINTVEVEGPSLYRASLADAAKIIRRGKTYIPDQACDPPSPEMLFMRLVPKNLSSEFKKRCGYDLAPYLPFVVLEDAYTKTGYQNTWTDDPQMLDIIRRVRYDFNRTLIDIFLERFTQTYHEWCHKHGTLSRYQAYGYPWLMGMAEGYLVPDIPESNGWIFSPDAYHHGYYVWNKYASSGGHLTGKSIISSEAMTNTHGVFQTTLEYIKHDDDMNFIMGINHSVLHGFNYSPPEAGFPGWVRYGTYFSEQNSWWQYFKYWAEYNARLSAVFQYCKPVVDVAILAPTADWLSTAGLARVPFHLQPWYCHRLWEPIHQIGGAADYLSEKVIQESDKKSGKLKYGAMAYKMLILPEVETIKPETAQALEEFASVGGKIIFVAKQPSRSPCLKEAALNDQSVKNAISEIIDRYPRKVAVVSKPIDESDLIPWTEKLFHHFEIKHPVHISPPNENVFQIHHECEGRDIFFFVNSNFDESIDFKAVFQTETKTPWRWDAETGQRTPFAYNSSKNRLTIHLEPLESLLLVFEPQLEKQFDKNGQRQLDNVIEINGSWHVRFEPMFNTFFEIEVSELDDLSQSQDMRFANFAGTVIYQTDFKVEETESYLLDLGNVYGVSEVKLNDQPLGIKWYGRHRYLCSNAIVNGENHLEIKITTVLLNYVKSLTNNPTAQIWTQDQKPVSVGLVGPVRLNSSK